jgi:zinc D-Ala-D-Ala carboxypeptidase
MQLSPNFTLEEFLVSQTAARHGIDMTPPQEVIDNLRRLCEKVLQPLRERAGSPVIISSGYRPRVLNDIIGGSKTSAHPFGRAADVRVIDMTPLETCELIVDMGLEFDQLIHEFGRWVHVGISDEPRSELLTAVNEDGRTRYIRGLVDVPSPA